MCRSESHPWLHRFAVLTAVATLALIAIGGLVTSHGVGMAVPDWPTTNGYNMFAFPIAEWVGGIFYEHTHRLAATVVGLLVVALTRWVGGRPSRLPLLIIGTAEVVAGLALLRLAPKWNGAGHFLSGIGGVVVLAAAIWVRNAPAPRPLPQLGWLAFALVQIQGLLGGLRVVLFTQQIGIFHAALAQLFFVLLCAIALLSSHWWLSARERLEARPNQGESRYRTSLNFMLWGTTVLIFCQLVLGAAMRHQHAGLAIPDFPLAYGKVWPAMDEQAVERYNQRRLEVTETNPITSAQIALQMTHRIMAILILGAVALVAWVSTSRQDTTGGLGKWPLTWLGLIALQVLLGAATIWSNKAADIATAHVIVGALSLALGALMSIVSFRDLVITPRQAVSGERAQEQIAPTVAVAARLQ